MNGFLPNPADQVAYFEQMDEYTQKRYEQVANDGAQKHLDTKW